MWPGLQNKRSDPSGSLLLISVIWSNYYQLICLQLKRLQLKRLQLKRLQLNR
ncbi:hypothetical protein [Alkalihalophilus marmarensis]|uniref:hypothetical protein n=1 Tax=Alkalihalophilus marmarensis TaxID=521377 RepID=UPI002E1A745B|nr:hypothetical protein [Alkalihalophilus marmarensis]